MGHQAFGVAQIVGDVDQLERIGEAERRFLAAFDLERHHAAAAVHLGAGQIVLRMIGAERIEHARDLALPGQEIGDLQRVLAMRAHAQVQRLQALQMQPGIERADRWVRCCG